MPQLGPKIQGEERPEHIPAPAEATWVDEWRFVERSCGHQYWVRYFLVRSWTVGTYSPELIQIELVGSQFADGSTQMWICLDGDSFGLRADDALMLAETLSLAADELERIDGGML